MFATFLFSARLYITLCVQSLRRSPELGRLSIRGRLIRLVLCVLALPFWLLHWLGFLLDEVLFRGYRQVQIREPVFVLGVPRSGTTFLHRTLAEDRALFTTVSTWEAIFAPSITQRVFWRGLARLDSLAGRPLGRLLGYLEKKLFAGLEGVHDVSLDAAEEDYLLLIPMLSCFILFLPFSDSGYIWNLSRLDWAMSERDRERILDFYGACLKKHLYFHGKDKRYLSKNAAFASWVKSLQLRFPDARLVVCLREPDKAVPSLLGSLEPGARFFELDLKQGRLPELLVEMMQHYYRHLIQNLQPDWVVVHMHELQANPAAIVKRVYTKFALPLHEDFLVALDDIANAAGGYTSKTRYIEPVSDPATDFFRERFPWYYDLVDNEI